MDAIGLFLTRYGDLHRGLVDGLLSGLPEARLRGRPHPGVNTIVWLLWHSARIEDLSLNRFLADRPQVLDDGWLERLGVARRDVGTGMSDTEVNELSARVGLQADLTAMIDKPLRARSHVGAVLRLGGDAGKAQILAEFIDKTVLVVGEVF